VAEALDLRPRELALAAVLALLVLAAGLYPEGVLGVIRAATEGWVARISPAGA